MDERERRFEQVVGEVAAPLHRYLVRRLPSSEVDDVLAETTLVLWRRLDEVPADAVLPWAYGVARNCLANAVRAERRRTRLDGRLRSVGGGEPREMDEEDASADAAALRVHAALDRLTPEQRELLRLWAWEDLTPAEIAVVLGTTANAVSIRLHRARRRVADLLADDERSGAEPDMEG